jgi:aldehyde dehydrogenase (NAD+)
MNRYQQFIDGQWCGADGDEWLESYDPYTGKPWALIPRSRESDAERAVAAARRAFRDSSWREMSATARGALLRRLGELVAERADALAETETRDNGKLLAEMRTQVRYVPQWYYYYGGLADKIEGAVLPSDKASVVNFTRYEPLGPVLALTAWNSPLLLVAYKLAPALAAGNTIVLKPSEHASVSSLQFAELVEQAGFPAGVINVVTGLGGEVGAALSAHPDIAKITFTGGERTGREIAAQAGRKLSGAILELGGKSPNIVFEDANLDNAVNGVISGIFAASGQTCVAGSRLLLQDSIHDEFIDRLLAASRDITVGNPQDESTQVGPIATRELRDGILAAITDARSQGANCLLGGAAAEIPESPLGWFVQPTIFTGVTRDMRIAQDEVFGPVLAVLRFSDMEQAIDTANDSRYGLAAGVWTADLRRALLMSQRLEAGTVWVNTYRAVSFMSPFGGYKSSGLGRENGAEAIKQYLQTKSVWLSTEEAVGNPFVIR